MIHEQLMHSVYARYFFDEEIAKGKSEMPETLYENLINSKDMNFLYLFTLDLSISSQDDNIEVIEIPPESDDDSPDPKRPKKDEPNSGSSSKKERKDTNTQPKKSNNVVN